MADDKISIDSASVKVMRSFDYCHFEIVLTSISDQVQGMELGQVDAMRKEAARLADKAVVQYRIAKANAAKLGREESDRAYQVRRIERIRSAAETDRSPEEKAELKAFDDHVFQESRRYDYEDDFDDYEPSDL